MSGLGGYLVDASETFTSVSVGIFEAAEGWDGMIRICTTAVHFGGGNIVVFLDISIAQQILRCRSHYICLECFEFFSFEILFFLTIQREGEKNVDKLKE